MKKTLKHILSITLSLVMLLSAIPLTGFTALDFEANANDMLLGDVDSDGFITAKDARLILRAAAGLEWQSDIIEAGGDIDGDCSLTAADARTAIRGAVGLENLGPYGFDVPGEIPERIMNNLKFSTSVEDEEIIVHISVTKPEDFIGYEMSLNYNTELLQYKKYRFSESDSIFALNNGTEGELKIAFSFIEDITGNNTSTEVTEEYEEIELLKLYFEKKENVKKAEISVKTKFFTLQEELYDSEIVVLCIEHKDENVDYICDLCNKDAFNEHGFIDSIEWKYYDNGTLMILGEGNIPDYYDIDYNPWYKFASEINKVIFSDKITGIGQAAFPDCTALTDITIPGSVTYIGKDAFYGCDSLTSITIPDSVTSIGSYAFCGCSSLTSITIPDSVTSIGDRAFGDCSSLTSITLPDSVTSIGNYAFCGCDSLTSITLPDSVTSIGNSAFRDCSSLTNITLPDSVTSIGYFAFGYCSSLTSITIPDGVTNIGERAFYDCSSLTSITIPDGVTSIEDWAFGHCSSLTSIKIPDSVTSIGWSAFEGCSSLTNITIPDSVTSIAYCAFHSCSSLTSITIPDSVTSIGDMAFCNCSSLTSITIPDSVTSIASKAFYNCSSLTSITISDSVTSIVEATFYGCSRLTSIIIPDSVTGIAGNAFEGCSSLTSITFCNPQTWINDSSDAVPDGAVIYGYKGSTAQAYAEKYDRKFVAIEEHSHLYSSSVTKPATCKEAGVKTFTCSCGDSYTESIAKLTTHKWGEWKVTKAATYEAAGKEERSCSVCKKTESRTIAKLEYKDIEIAQSEEIKALGENSVLVLSDSTVGEILNNIKGNVSITDKDGKSVSKKDSIASGMTVTLKDSSGKVIDEKTIVVPGDNNGDGKITAADARSALRASVNLDKLNSWQTDASNVDNIKENKITAADARFILRASVGLESFKDWMKTIK